MAQVSALRPICVGILGREAISRSSESLLNGADIVEQTVIDTVSSRITEFRDSLSQRLQECERLLPRVEECVTRVTPIRALVDQRMILALTGPDVASQEAYTRLSKEIEVLFSPFHAVTTDVGGFVTKLLESLDQIPVEPRLLSIRDQIAGIPLVTKIHQHFPPMSMTDAYRDLRSLRVRLQDLLDSVKVARELAPKANVAAQIITLPEGVTWSDLWIRFTNDHAFQVHVHDKPVAFRGYVEAGFENARTRRPVSSWKSLMLLGAQEGEMERPKGLSRDISHMEKQIQDLRRRLQLLFALGQDPFWPYREVKRYRTRFKVTVRKSDSI